MIDVSARLVGMYTLLILGLAALFAPAGAMSAQLFVACTNDPSDAAKINRTIQNSEGDEVVIQGGCLINEVIELRSHRAYRGESRTGTVLKQASGANLSAILASSDYLHGAEYSGSPLSVRSLTIEGNSAGNAQSRTNGIVLRNWLSVIEDVRVSDMGGHGIVLSNRSAGGRTLKNTMVNGQVNGNFIEDSGGHGFYVDDGGNSITDWQLMNNWIASSGKDGIHLDNAAGWMIERNHVYGVQGHAIYANRLWGTSIWDNYIESFGESSKTGTYGGIVAKVQGGLVSTITENRIVSKHSNPDSDYRYIDVSVNYGTGVLVVANNAMRTRSDGSAEIGIGLHYTADGNRRLIVTSTGNVVHDIGTAKVVGPNVDESTGI